MGDRYVRFHGGIGTLLGFGVAFDAVTALWVPLSRAVADRSALLVLLTEIAKFAVIAGIVWGLLRADGVRLADLGASRRHLAPALVTFGVLWLALNCLGLGLAAWFERPWGVRLL